MQQPTHPRESYPSQQDHDAQRAADAEMARQIWRNYLPEKRQEILDQLTSKEAQRAFATLSVEDQIRALQGVGVDIERTMDQPTDRLATAGSVAEGASEEDPAAVQEATGMTDVQKGLGRTLHERKAENKLRETILRRLGGAPLGLLTRTNDSIIAELGPEERLTWDDAMADYEGYQENHGAGNGTE